MKLILPVVTSPLQAKIKEDSSVRSYREIELRQNTKQTHALINALTNRFVAYKSSHVLILLIISISKWSINWKMFASERGSHSIECDHKIFLTLGKPNFILYWNHFECIFETMKQG